MRYLLLCSGLLLISQWSCKSAKEVPGDQLTWGIASQKVDCQGVAPQTCFLIKESADADWSYFYDAIVGFDYEPGFEYRIKVARTERPNPPADASAYRYTLVEVLSKEADPLLRLHDIWALTAINGEAIATTAQRPNLELYPTEGRVVGFAGCNTLQGGITVTENELSFGQMAVTEMACPELEIEIRFLEMLRRVDRYVLDGLELRMYDSNDLLLEFRKVD